MCLVGLRQLKGWSVKSLKNNLFIVHFIGNISRGNWTEEGCKMKGTDNETKTYTCECNHLTNFAVLVVSENNNIVS